MGIFDRISDIVKSNLNDMLDNAEDPEKMLKQMVLEMEESVNKATLAIANAIANEKGLERKIQKNSEEAAEWMQRATQAVQASRDDLARAAIEKKNICERNSADLVPLHAQAAATTAKMREQLAQLKSKLDEARARQSTLIARSQAAKAQKTIAQSFSGVGSDAFSKFDKYEGKIEKLEAEASAFEELAGENTDLEAQFKNLGADQKVDDELAKLKAELSGKS